MGKGFELDLDFDLNMDFFHAKAKKIKCILRKVNKLDYIEPMDDEW